MAGSDKKTLIVGSLLRYGAAAVIVVGLAAVVVASYIPWTDIQSCRDVEVGDVLKTACSPIGTNDIVLVGVVLLIAAALVSPELSEFSVAGLITLKRRVAEVKELAEEAKETAKRTAEIADKAAQVADDNADNVRKALEREFEDRISAFDLIRQFIQADTEEKANDLAARLHLSVGSVRDTSERLRSWYVEHPDLLDSVEKWRTAKPEEASNSELTSAIETIRDMWTRAVAAAGPASWGVLANLRA